LHSLPFIIATLFDPTVAWKPLFSDTHVAKHLRVDMHWADRIGRQLKLRDLHILLAVAEAGSMAKASERLAITHPVVSKTISDLEQSLGVRLFDRSSQGVELTSYGQALLKCGVAVFDELRQGIEQIESLADPNCGELRIGCPEIAIAGLLPVVAEQFLRQYSKVHLHVVHADTALRQFDELRRRNVELLIGRLPRPFVEDDLVAEELFDEPFLAFAGLQSRWARRRQIRLADLIEESWVLPPYDSIPGALIAQFFRSHHLPPPRARLATLSVQLTVALVASGQYVGLLPASVLHFSARRLSLKILPVKASAEHTAAGIITVKGRTLSPLAERFVRCAREMAKSLPGAMSD
jgi:DNA-binding transcriptional LysR family regulator